MIILTGVPKLETDQLTLKMIEYQDAKSMFENLTSDERITDKRISPAHQSISETVKRLNTIIELNEMRNHCFWGIFLSESGDLIGEIDLYNFDYTTGNCEVSYSIGYQWWNQGFGTEALRAVIYFAFKKMNVNKVSATHNTDNPASGAVLSKVGMKQEGVLRRGIMNAKK